MSPPPFTLPAGGITLNWIKALALRLDDDDEEAEQKARMAIERRTERELLRALQEMRLTLFPEDYGDAADPHAEAVRIHRAFLEEQRLRDAISRAIQDSADLGVSVAVKKLENVGFGFDYTLANIRARDWVLRYTDDLLNQLGTTSGRIVGQAVGRWIDNGEPLPALIRDLEPAFGRRRAELIAATESTRAYARGTVEGYRESGVVTELVWQTANDEIICPYCGRLHGKVVGIEERFDGALPDDLRSKVKPFDLPPAHPGCRCWVSARIAEPKRERRPKPPKPIEAPKPVVTPPVDDLAERRRRAEEIAAAARAEAERLAAEERARQEAARPADTAQPGPFRYLPTRRQLDMVEANVDSAIRRIALDEHIPTQEVERRVSDGYKNLVANHDLAIQFSSKKMNQFIADPRFKTQFETNTSGGALNRELRATAEFAGLGAPLDLDPKQRPIYGFLNLGERAQYAVSQYGDITFILKDDVRQRTTATMDDSLYNFRQGNVAGTPVEQPGKASWDNRVRTLYDYAKDQNTDTVLNGVSYVEIQVQGGVSISDVRGVIDRGSKLTAAQRLWLVERGVEIWDN